MIKNLEKHIKEWTEENTPLGKELGYPDCCIKEFCNQPPVLLRNSKPKKDSKFTTIFTKISELIPKSIKFSSSKSGFKKGQFSLNILFIS